MSRGRHLRDPNAIPALIGLRRARDLAFLEQLTAAQMATKRDAAHTASQDVARLCDEVRRAVGARECSLDDLLRAIRACGPSRHVFDDALPAEDTPTERPRARAVERLLDRVLSPFRRKREES